MASLRDIRKRIASVKNTRQITKAMKMVAAAKLRRATDSAISARPYSKKLLALVGQMASQVSEAKHPLLEVHQEAGATRLILFASDKGLCGSFNSNLFKAVDAFIAERQTRGPVRVIAVGKKAVAHVNRMGYTLEDRITDLPPSQYFEVASQLAARMSTDYTKGEVGSVVIAYQEFVSALTQRPTVRQLLPVPLDEVKGGDSAVDYIYEPGQADLLGMLLPRLIENRLHQALLESNASEQASRMMAMDNATRNASEMITSLTLEYNQARQAAITTELVEIVSGAEAL